MKKSISIIILFFILYGKAFCIEGNFINLSFERMNEQGFIGWEIEEINKGKGVFFYDRSNKSRGEQSLKIIPNKNNRVVEKPIGLYQSIKMDIKKEIILSISVDMRNDKDSEALLYLMALNEIKGIIGYTVIVSYEDKFKKYTEKLILPIQTKYLIVICATSSRKGSVWFDNISIKRIENEDNISI